jgi:hypothetical protein
LAVEETPPGSLRASPRNARRHSRAQIKQIARSISAFGFLNPILVGDDGEVIAGHGRLEAATLLRLPTVPVIRIGHLSDAERRAFILADNQIASNSSWDTGALKIELAELTDLGVDLSLSGFAVPDIELAGRRAERRRASPRSCHQAAGVQRSEGPALAPAFGPWLLGRHRVACASAVDAGALRRLLGGDQPDLLVTSSGPATPAALILALSFCQEDAPVVLCGDARLVLGALGPRGAASGGSSAVTPAARSRVTETAIHASGLLGGTLLDPAGTAASLAAAEAAGWRARLLVNSKDACAAVVRAFEREYGHPAVLLDAAAAPPPEDVGSHPSTSSQTEPDDVQ